MDDDEADDERLTAEGIISASAVLEYVGIHLPPTCYEVKRLSGGLTNDNICIHLVHKANHATIHFPQSTIALEAIPDRIVVRRFRAQVSERLHYDRSCEFENASAAAKAGISAHVLAFIPAEEPKHGGALVLAFVEGATLNDGDVAEYCRSSQGVQVLVRAIRELHDRCPPFRNAFVPSIARKAYEEEVHELSKQPVSWPSYEALVERMQRLQERLDKLDEPLVPCHNDLLAANFISQARCPNSSTSGGGKGQDELILIDFELSGMATASWELGNIVSENGLDEDEEAIKQLVYSYWSFADRSVRSIDEPTWLDGRIARVRANALISKVTWSAWGHVLHSLRTEQINGFDYAAWSLERVAKAKRVLLDDEAFEALLQAVQKDDLDVIRT